MEGKPRVSIYVKARKWWLLMLLALPAIVWLIPLFLTGVGLGSKTALLVVGPLVLAWFLFGAVQSSMLACPVCGCSLFRRGFVGVPWPAKTCSKCKNDLTMTRR